MVKIKKGFFHSIDAVIAIFIIAGLFVLILNLPVSNYPVRNLAVNSQDVIHSLSAIKVDESKSTVIQNLIDEGKISERQKDLNLLEYISELWALEEEILVHDIIEDITQGLFNEMKFSFYLDDDILFNNYGDGLNLSRATSSITVTGVIKDHFTKGISVRSFLSGIGNKVTSEYVFFGGFVGQGNITQRGAVLPNDADIVSMIFESYIGTDFDLYINGNFCKTLNYNDVGVNSTIYDLIICKDDLLYTQENLFEFRTNDVNNAYISGGFIEITYNTKTFSMKDNFNKSTYYFPSIDGLINYYSSFYVPGELNNMELFLHYDFNSSEINDESIFLMIGNKTVYKNESIGENSIYLSNDDLVSILNYNDLSDKTIPIRLGFENLSYSVEFEQGNADVILINDLSGSMDRCLSNNNACGPSCPGLECRFDLAKNLSKEFASRLLEVEGNRLSLVTYSDHAQNQHDLSDDYSSIANTIDNFVIGGATCTCCAIRLARLILEQQSDSTRDQFVIVMTDGIANIRCFDDVDNFNGCGYSWCGSTFWCGCPQYLSPCGGCLTYDSVCGDYTSDHASNDAVDAAALLRQSTGAQVDVVGFGAGAIGCAYGLNSLEQIALAGEGVTYASDDVEGLSDIYGEILDQIIQISTSSQLINVDGNISSMKLFGDSYINYTFTPYFEKYPAGFMTMSLSTDHFNSCDVSIDLLNVSISDAVVTSYSSKYWTDLLSVNNNVVFNLSKYSDNYFILGDPFKIMVPVNLLNSGINNFKINIGESPTNSSGCSPHSRLIYTIMVPTSISQSGIFSVADGCNWLIEYEEGDFDTITVPSNYEGDNNCFYTSLNVEYNIFDGIDNAVYKLLRNLDFENNNKLNIRLDTNEFNIETLEITDIPSLLGPSRFSVRLWK